MIFGASRMEVLHSLLSGEAGIVVASVDAACQRVIPSEDLIERVVLLKVGAEKDPLVLEEALTDMGYERVEAVDDCDQFTRRGGIVDIFPSTSEKPVRIEFFGDEIESVRPFDPGNQKSVGELRELEIVPCREVILSRRLAARAIEKISEAARKRKLLSSVVKVNLILERMDSGVYFQGIESFLPFFYERFETIFDYFGKKSTIVVDEPPRILDRAERVIKQMNKLYTGDVFNAPRKKKTVTRAGSFLTRFAEISLWDYVVHVDHGIGVYEGIILRETEGEEKDFISVRYGGGRPALHTPRTGHQGPEIPG